MATDNDVIWNPDKMEEGSAFVPGEQLVQEGESYRITKAQMTTNQFDPSQKELRMLLDGPGAPTEEGIMLRIRPSVRKGSKWHRWLEALKELGITPGSPEEMEGLRFIAGKHVQKGQFRDREDPTKMVERTVVTIFPAALDHGEAAPEAEVDEDVLDALVELADGKKFAVIMTAVIDDDRFSEEVRKKISSKELLMQLIDDERLALDGSVYVKA